MAGKRVAATQFKEEQQHVDGYDEHCDSGPSPWPARRIAQGNEAAH
jgi:hypothetical protein